MHSRVITTSLLILLVCASCFAENYSCRADVFMPDGYSNTTKVWSPDHKNYVLLSSKPEHAESDEGKFLISIYSGTRRLVTFVPEDLSAATFVKWSPDSKGVYVMWSDGGAVGGYHVRAFLVSEDHAVESPAPKAVAADFAKHYYCKSRGNNLYALRWESGSKQLLLRPEVYPASDCGAQMGFTSGYLVNTANGKIDRTYTAEEIQEDSQRCPSNVYPSAFATQTAIDEYRKAHDNDLPKP